MTHAPTRPGSGIEARPRRWSCAGSGADRAGPDVRDGAAATGSELGAFVRLMDAVADPYRPSPGFERYADPAPEDFGRYRTFCT